MRAKLILVTAFITSSFCLAYVVLRPAQNVAVVKPLHYVLATAVAAPKGTLLRTEDVAWKQTDEESLPGAFNREAPAQDQTQAQADSKAVDQIAGAVVRQDLAKGDILIQDAILKPGDRGFLSIVLRPGMRAVTVGVTTATGSAGLIYPNDQVDVLLVQSFKQADVAVAKRSVGETVVHAARVLAIDQHLQAMPKTGPTDNTETQTVTLEASPEDVERIAVADDLGKLSLALRGSEVDATKAKPMWADDVSPALKEAHQVPKERVEPTAPRGVLVLRADKSEISTVH